MAGRTYARRIQPETGDRGWLSTGGAYRGAYILDAPASRDMVGASWVCPQPTARSSGYEGELSVKPVSEWCDGSGAAPRPLKGGALGAGGESDTKENPRNSAQPKRLKGGCCGAFRRYGGRSLALCLVRRRVLRFATRACARVDGLHVMRPLGW